MEAPSGEELSKELEIYLVGGAVRDYLLAELQGNFIDEKSKLAYWLAVEKDWVVVGSTPDEMLQLGFKPVGKSFPVFLHPKTHDEYALARTEHKVSKGYTGFEFYAEKDVTLEEDLKRRDLTINAIAAPPHYNQISKETIIDPYQGYNDLKHKIFRHVSDAFAEDPVRILRIARLAARFEDFSVDPTTQKLMELMVKKGEVDALVPERVWQEWFRSLKESAPWRFFEILETCGAKQKLFPEIDNLALKKTILQVASRAKVDEPIKLAIQLFDLPESSLQALVERYRIPHEFKELALMISKFYASYLNLNWQSADVLMLFQNTDAFRRHKRFQQFLLTANYLDQGKNKAKSERLNFILMRLLEIDNAEIMAAGFKGAEFANELNKRRLLMIDTLLMK